MEPTPTGARPTPRIASRLVWAALVGVLAAVTAAGVISLSRRPTGEGGDTLGGLQVLGQVPAFRLTERSGRSVGSDDLRGKIWVADFIFTRCGGVCPVLTSRMARLQEQVDLAAAPDLRFVSFTVDPAHDTPAVLQEYAAGHRADESGWFFLTGARDDLYTLIKDGFRLSVAEREDAEADPNEMITHSDRFVLIDREGQIRGYYHGTDEESVERLRADLAQLRGEVG